MTNETNMTAVKKVLSFTEAINNMRCEIKFCKKCNNVSDNDPL